MLARLMRLYAVRKTIRSEGIVWAYRRLGARIGENVSLGPRVVIQRDPRNVTIGSGSSIGGRVLMDAWGDITIGSNVIINGEVDLLTAGHHLDSPTFEGDIRPISIGNRAWLPWRIIVLPGVTIGDCAVIGSGSVVTRDVPDYGVVAGNPARPIRERARVGYTYVPGCGTGR